MNSLDSNKQIARDYLAALVAGVGSDVRSISPDVREEGLRE